MTQNRFWSECPQLAKRDLGSETSGQYNYSFVKILSYSLEETYKFGKNLGKQLKGNEIIFLSGVLGAGKTVIAKGVANVLGLENIPSPTFNIFRSYKCKISSSASTGKLYHFDCYRLKKYFDLEILGWEEIISEENSVVILEWPECIEDIDLIKETREKPTKEIIEIEIKLGKKEGERKITINK